MSLSYVRMLDESSHVAEGFIYPDWDSIYQWAEHSLPPEQVDPFYQALTREWLERIRLNLGRTYRISESESFLLLSAEGAQEDERLLVAAEHSLKEIHNFLSEIDLGECYGKHVIMLMHDPQTYWRYISHFFSQKRNPVSAGVLIREGYSHVVLAPQPFHGMESTLFHELIHECLSNLELPRWLNEGLAQYAEVAGGYRCFLLDEDLARRHWSFWNGSEIQNFWKGSSFLRADERHELSYDLALVLIQLILRDLDPGREAFARFVMSADPADGGDAAARNFLNTDLGSIAAIFLGEGDWAPRPETWEP